MIIYWVTLFSLLTAHQPSEESPIPSLGSGFNSGLYINYDTSTLDLDGIFEFQANNGLFFELWGNSQINSSTSLNTSLGIIKKINPNLKIEYHNLPKDDPMKRKPDISLANNSLNWNPTINLDEGLELTINYFKEKIKNGN